MCQERRTHHSLTSCARGGSPVLSKRCPSPVPNRCRSETPAGTAEALAASSWSATRSGLQGIGWTVHPPSKNLIEEKVWNIEWKESGDS